MRSVSSIFKHLDYIEFLEKQVEINGSVYGYKAKLAEAADCQRSYLSQVLNRKADLSTDHVIGLAEFWKLNAAETDYLINLVLYARAGTKKLKEHLRAKIESQREDQENLVKRITEKTVLPEESAAIFYSNWQYLAINILTTIETYRTAAAIAERLQLREELVVKSLAQLEKLGLLVKQGQTWIPTNSTIHVPRDSQFNSLNHSHWRTKAVQDSYLASNDTVHYTSVCSISRRDAEKLKELALSLVDESRKIIAPSKEEELYCLTLDWFKV